MCNLDISDCIIIHDCPTIETHNSHPRRYVVRHLSRINDYVLAFIW